MNNKYGLDESLAYAIATLSACREFLKENTELVELVSSHIENLQSMLHKLRVMKGLEQMITTEKEITNTDFTLDFTQRGFAIMEFTDANGQKCTLQKSSRAFENEEYIWLGVHDLRMHLTQSDVKKLLPYLERFIKTGELHEN